jgi:DNA polymerase-3 subunit delta'
MRETLAKQDRVKGFLDRLSESPPQVVLLEGGAAAERMDTALYFAASLKCGAGPGACLDCRECVQIIERVSRDLFIFDSREGNIKVQDVRDVVPVFSQPPRDGGKRSVLFVEAQQLNPSTANLLLKSLEEPRPHTVFMLLAPQRERLLPTLVSRSWVLTLAWTVEREPGEEVEDWLAAMAEYMAGGEGWFARTGKKGAVSRDLALSVVLACQAELAGAMTGEKGSPLSARLAAMPPESLRRFDLVLSRAMEALNLPTPVNPALVLDWLATRVAPDA